MEACDYRTFFTTSHVKECGLSHNDPGVSIEASSICLWWMNGKERYEIIQIAFYINLLGCNAEKVLKDKNR